MLLFFLLAGFVYASHSLGPIAIPSRPGVRAIAQSRYCLDLKLRGLSDLTS